MKKFYLMVALAVMIPLSIFARTQGLYSEQPHQHFDLRNVGIKMTDVVPVKVNDAPAPQMSFKVLDTDLEYYWSTLWPSVTPFAYEAKSNTLVYVTTDRESVDGWADCNVYLHFSNDNGQNWTKTKVYGKKQQMAFFPSVAVLNPKNATDPEQFKIVITYTPFKPRPTPNDTLYYSEGNAYLYYNGTGWNNFEEYEEKAPTENNPGGVQQWGTTNKRMFAVESSKGTHFYTYGSLSPLNEGYQYGAYGFAYIDFTDDFPNPSSQLPRQWDPSVFRNPGSLTSSWNAPLRMSADNDGNLYAFVFNMFPDDPERRTPAFSKSTDNGKTWSDFSRMPFSVFQDFLADWNHAAALDPYIFAYPYTDWDAVAYGPDEFSMFIRMYSYVGTSTQDAVGTGHIAELRYKNGSWLPIRRVGEFRGTPLRIAYLGPTGTSVDSLDENLRYQELQAAVTKDGKSVVCKYLSFDAEDNLGVLENPTMLVNNPSTVIDSIACTDIFVGYRNIAETDWKPVFNATQDKWYNKGTYIPPMVPSINHVPLVEYITQEFTSETNLRRGYPYFLQNLVGDRILTTALVAVLDLGNPTVVRNEVIQRPKGLKGASVLENLPFSLNDIAPNPASEFAVVTYNLDNDAYVTVNLHNAMGQMVKTIFEGSSNLGLNTHNVLTNDLPAGAYYYSINVNGKTQTKLLNVVR